MISVIIATKNRADALRDISLPSLMRQDTADFEVIVWDASDTDDAQVVAQRFAPLFADRGVGFVFEKAPRAGSSSQRNDAVKMARGDVVFFIDDDSEVSSDGVSSLIRIFDSFEWLRAASLPLLGRPVDVPIARRSNPFVAIARRVLYLFRGGRATNRKIAPSTYNVSPATDGVGFAEWLTGCDMAFRRSVFDELCFNERLQRFGGYAWGEDFDMTHRVYLKYRTQLMVSPSGVVVHHTVPGGRLDKPRFVAATFYNSKIIRDGFNEYTRYGLLSFLWGMRVCRSLGLLLSGYSPMDILRGWKMYRDALWEDSKR